MSNIKIEIGVEFCVGRQQKHGVVKLAPADIGGGILGAAIVGVGPREFGGAVGAGEPDGFSAVVVFRVVPPVHQLDAAGEMLADRERGADSKVIVRDGPGKEQRAGVVPVGMRFDHFGAGAGHELA